MSSAHISHCAAMMGDCQQTIFSSSVCHVCVQGHGSEDWICMMLHQPTMESGHDLIHWTLKANRSKCFRLLWGFVRFGQEMQPACRPSSGRNAWISGPGLTNAFIDDGCELRCKLLPNQGRESVWGQCFGDWESFKFKLYIFLSERQCLQGRWVRKWRVSINEQCLEIIHQSSEFLVL